MVEASCFSTTTADAINTAKPCRAACDNSIQTHFRFILSVLWKENRQQIVPMNYRCLAQRSLRYDDVPAWGATRDVQE